MRIVVALGGNALLRRGQAMTVDNQRANVRIACEALTPVAVAHELVISHGNGPQVGAALVRSELAAAHAYRMPLDCSAIGAVKARGAPLDQFSFDVRFFTEVERVDRHLEKLRRGAEGEALDPRGRHR